MKNLPLFVSAFALCASTSYAAINCGTLPTCESLGYKDTVSQCPNQNKVLNCPFDINKGKCLHTAEIGDVKYSLKNKDHDGWLLCDGRMLTQADYSALFSVIGQKFCAKFDPNGSKDQQAYSSSKPHYVGGKCATGNFALPDYRGFYLRSMMTQRSDSIDAHSGGYYSNALVAMKGHANEWSLYHTEHTPMFARLPNIYGTWHNSTEKSGWFEPTGAISRESLGGDGVDGGKGHFDRMILSAENYNSIYSSTSSFVIPASYGIYTFIYAGKK